MAVSPVDQFLQDLSDVETLAPGATLNVTAEECQRLATSAVLEILALRQELARRVNLTAEQCERLLTAALGEILALRKELARRDALAAAYPVTSVTEFVRDTAGRVTGAVRRSCEPETDDDDGAL